MKSYKKKSAYRLNILAVCSLCAAVFFLLSSCGSYFGGEVAGYVKDSDTEEGINGAVIRIFLEEPASADAETFIVKTASNTSGGNAGYFSHKIMWQTSAPKFGDDGDSGTVWLGITHDDYKSAVVKVPGILSDTVNLVPDIKLDRATFSATEVTGKVVNVSGSAVNGVQVVLDLASTTDDDRDYVTTTATINGESGMYRFTNVTWKDENPDSASTDTETIYLYISENDANYQWKTGNTPNKLTMVITSGQSAQATQDITVTRKPRTSFSTSVTGRCIKRYTTGMQQPVDIGVQGVEVRLSFTDSNGAKTLYAQTNANGEFTFNVDWTNTSPAGGTGSVPEGEDTLTTNIDYDSTDFTDVTGFVVKSWLNPNYAPDAIKQY